MVQGQRKRNGNRPVTRKQPAALKYHEIVRQGTRTLSGESSAQATCQKPGRAKEAAINKHLFAPPGLNKIAAQAERQTGGIWPRGKKIMGIYQIEGVLGEGGMGLVYKAKDVATNRYVAIKSLALLCKG